MKTVPSLLLAVIVVLGYVCYRQQATILEQRNHLASLEAQVAATKAESTPNSLEYQEKCAEQARKAFQDAGYKPRDLAGYENHYNTKLSKCFILVENFFGKSPTVWIHRNLFDAYEGKVYAEYSWRTVKDKKYWEVPPFMCKVVLPSGEDHFCKSDDEFQELISAYMGNR